MSNISEPLNELMDEDGYNQSTLAEAMKTPRAKISLYKSGKSVPNFKYFIAFIEFFHCSADFLIGLSDDPKRDIKYKPIKSFNARLRELFKLKGKTHKSLVDSKHISWNTLHGWFTGKSFPSIENLKKLAEFFDCTVDYILGREN